MARLDASEVARLLTELSRRTALAGGNPYRARAYARAAESLSSLTSPLDEFIAEDRLQEVAGVGDAIAEIVTKLHTSGTHPSLEKLRRDVPSSVLEMLSVPGLRPDKVVKLHKELGISSLQALEAAAQANELGPVKGLGPALQRKILEGLEIRRSAGNSRHVHRAAELLAVAEQDLKNSHQGLTRITMAGDFRRGSELVSDLALVAQTLRLTVSPQILKTGEMTVYLTDASRFGITLLLATGSEEHLRQLRAFAEAKGLTLTPDGVLRNGEIIASASEADIYKALGLQFIPPELREGRGEIALAAKKQLPKLVDNKDVRGVLHAHTVASDGVNTLEEMAEATRERGYAYFGVADHSKSAHYAGGLSVDQIDAQHREIDRLNASYRGKFRVYKGIESDILADGSLDYPDDVLRRFDFVVASIHGRFRMDREAQTERLLRAVANPFTTILGHMTGRQLLRRRGYEVDVEKVLEASAKHGVAVELNANPWRLDLDWRWHARGLELGCVFSVNPDAHSTSEIDLVRWGIAMARKGGIPKTRVINCLGRKAFATFLRDRCLATVAKAGSRTAKGKASGSRASGSRTG
jgi:DNA polymerase (family 10)